MGWEEVLRAPTDRWPVAHTPWPSMSTPPPPPEARDPASWPGRYPPCGGGQAPGGRAPVPSCPGAGQTALVPAGSHPPPLQGEPAEPQVTPRQAGWTQELPVSPHPGDPAGPRCLDIPTAVAPAPRWPSHPGAPPHAGPPGRSASGLWAPASARNQRRARQVCAR